MKVQLTIEIDEATNLASLRLGDASTHTSTGKVVLMALDLLNLWADANAVPSYKPFEVAAGNFEDCTRVDFEQTACSFKQVYKYTHSFTSLSAANDALQKCKNYHFALLTYLTPEGKRYAVDLNEVQNENQIA